MALTVEHVAKRYFAASRAMDIEAWTALFAGDAVSEDPVGQPPHVGKAAIREFLSGILGQFREIGLFEDFVVIAGKRRGREMDRTRRGQERPVRAL